MMRRLIFLLPILLFAISAIAQNPEEEIRTMLENRDQEVKELLGPKGQEYTQEQRDKLKSIINGVIDFRSMASYALGDTFNEIENETQDEFVSLFGTIVRDQSLNRLDIYRADVTYDEISVKENGSEAFVATTAQLENVRTPVSYEMEKRDDEWVITDMIIDDVSTAESYNRQFQSNIRRRGFDALMNSMRNRAARAENS